MVCCDKVRFQHLTCCSDHDDRNKRSLLLNICDENLTQYHCNLFPDAKAGGAAAPIAKITKHKMQNDEALKILHIEGRKNLNPEILLQVQFKLKREG